MEDERARLHKDLIKLGDMMADGLHYEDPSISREYRKISKALFPEMYPKKFRKPNRKLVNSLKECNCGAKGWQWRKYNNGNVGFCCKNCGKETGECKTNTEARDKWNKLIE